MSRPAWEVSGGFSENGVGPGEEIEFSQRCLPQRGIPIIFCDAFHAVHIGRDESPVHGSRSSERTSGDPIPSGECDTRILVDYQGDWGLGDLVCSEPLIRGLREHYGPGAELRYKGRAGNAAFAPELDGVAADDFRSEIRVDVKLFTHMDFDEYARLEAHPSLVDHMCSYGGISPKDRTPRLNLGAPEREFVAGLPLEEVPRPIVAVCADDFDRYRSWPPDRFQRLAEHLKRRGAGLVEVGVKGGLGLGLDFVGKLSVRQTAAVLSMCDLFVGNNSGLFHYAQAADVPCVIFFSFALPERFIHDDRLVVIVQRKDLPCINCMTRDFAERNRLGCQTIPDAACMLELPLEAGIEALDLVFSEYLADCPVKGEEGNRARGFRARTYSDQANHLFALGHFERANRFTTAAFQCGREVSGRQVRTFR